MPRSDSKVMLSPLFSLPFPAFVFPFGAPGAAIGGYCTFGKLLPKLQRGYLRTSSIPSSQTRYSATSPRDST